jgi:hypothetical protein
MGTYHFEYDATHKILAVRFVARLTDEILMAFYAAAPGHFESRDVRAGILDLTDVTSLEVSTDAIREIAELAPVLADPVPRFVIAPGDLGFGLGRMLQLMSGRKRENLRVVRSAEEAYAALGVLKPHFERVV